MKRLFFYVRRYRSWYALGALCTLAFAILQMSLPLLMRDAINAVHDRTPQQLVWIAAAMVVVAILMGVARALSRIITFNTGRNIEFDLRNDLFTHLTKLGPDFYERLKTGVIRTSTVPTSRRVI